MRVHTWAIGLFLTLGIVFFTAILFLIGNRYGVFGEHAHYYAEFPDIAGVPVGAVVRVSGLDAGEVKSIQIPADASSKVTHPAGELKSSRNDPYGFRSVDRNRGDRWR